MTKVTEEFSQFTESVACREYILTRDEETSEPKGWIRGNTNIGPVLEVATCCLHCNTWIGNCFFVFRQRQFSFVGQNFMTRASW